MNYTYLVNVHEYVFFAVLLSQSNIGCCLVLSIAMQLAKKMQNLYIYNEVNIFYIMYSLLHCFFQKVTFSQNGTWSRTLRALCALQMTNPIQILGVFHNFCIYRNPNKKMYLFFVVFLTGTLIHFASMFHEKISIRPFVWDRWGCRKI